MIRTRALVGEALRSTVRHLLTTGALALIAALATAAVLLTTGNSYATEAAVIGSLDERGARVVVAYDHDGAAGIRMASVDCLSRTDAAEWFIGLGEAVDHHVDHELARATVGVRAVFGAFEDVVVPAAGRLPREGEAVLGERAARDAGLLDGIGALSAGGVDIPVVGVFRAEGPFDRLNDVALAVPDSAEGERQLRYLYGLAPAIGQIDVLADAMRAGVVASDPDLIRIEKPSAAADLERVISGELGSAARRSTTLILATSGLLILIVAIMVVGSRRRDVGRWRALGASRSAVVAGFVIEVVVPVVLGASVGALSAQLWNQAAHDFRNSWIFAGALVVDATLVAVTAAVAPAIAAASRDPVRVLRVP